MSVALIWHVAICNRSARAAGELGGLGEDVENDAIFDSIVLISAFGNVD